MTTAWMVVEIVLGVLGSILVWIGIVGVIANLHDRHRARATRRPSTRPPARL